MNNIRLSHENNLSQIPNEIIAKEIFPNFEHRVLTNLRLVSKQFKKNSDNDALFEEKDLKMKKSWESVLNIKDRIKLEKNNSIRIQNKIEKKNTKLKQLTESWFGFFVSLLSCKICVILKINTLFIRLFTSVASEVKKQSDCKVKISSLVNEKWVNRLNLRTLSIDKKLIKLSHKRNEKEYELVLADDKIKDLFGGRKNFERLPILDIGNRGGGIGEIDFIKGEEMSAPIMRGVDCQGREFFSIRACLNLFKKRPDFDVRCQTFYRRFIDVALWTDAGCRIFPSSYSLILDRNIHDKKSYDLLKKFIEERGNNQYSIC